MMVLNRFHLAVAGWSAQCDCCECTLAKNDIKHLLIQSLRYFRCELGTWRAAEYLSAASKLKASS